VGGLSFKKNYLKIDEKWSNSTPKIIYILCSLKKVEKATALGENYLLGESIGFRVEVANLSRSPTLHGSASSFHITCK
jgi:hypothetical protein